MELFRLRLHFQKYFIVWTIINFSGLIFSGMKKINFFLRINFSSNMKKFHFTFLIYFHMQFFSRKQSIKKE